MAFNPISDTDKVLQFYGGSLPYGTEKLSTKATKLATEIEVSFNPKISSIKKHKFVIENDRITKFYEYKTDPEIASSKTEFFHNAHLTENHIFDSKNNLIYSGVSFGDPSMDLISFNKYLRKETKEFYQGSLTEEAKIIILGKKFFILRGGEYSEACFVR